MQRVAKRGLMVVLFLTVAFFLALPVSAREFEASQALNAWEPGSPHLIVSFPHLGSLIDTAKQFSSSEPEEESPLFAWFHPFQVRSLAFAGGLNGGVLQAQGIISYAPEASEWLNRIAQGELTEEDLALWNEEDVLVKGPEEVTELGMVYTLVLDPYDPMARILLTARDNLVIFGYTEDNLRASFKALEDESTRFQPERRFGNLPNYILFNDGGFTQIGLLGNEMPVFLKDSIRGEIAFGNGETQWDLRGFSTAARAWFDETILNSIDPLTNETPLIGGGRTLLAMAANTDFIALKETLIALMGGEENFSFVYDEVLGMLSGMGLSEQTIADLLTGSLHIVMGGDAATFFAPLPLPGAYLVLKGQGEAAHNVVEIAAAMGTEMGGLPLEKMDLPGWDVLYGMSMPATAVLGAKGSDLYIGLLDPQKVNEPSQASPRMLQLAKAEEKRMGWFYLDLFALDSYLLELLEQHDLWTMLAGESAGDVGHGILLAHQHVTSTTEGFLTEALSLEEGHFALFWGTLAENVQARWSTIESYWKENFASPMLDMVEGSLNVDLQGGAE